MKTAILATLAALYPLLIWSILHHFGPQFAVVALIPVGLFVFLQRRSPIFRSVNGIWMAGIAAIACAAIMGRTLLPLLFYPLLVNMLLLALFSLSLVRPPTIIERLARLQDPDLDEQGVAYVRKVTLVWCLFFLLNGTAAAITIILGDTALWALYNGLVSYLLMGALFAGEWLVRRHVRRPAGS